MSSIAPQLCANIEVLKRGTPAQQDLAKKIVLLLDATENVAALAASIPSPSHLADWCDLAFTRAQTLRAHIAEHYPEPKPHFVPAHYPEHVDVL